MVRRIDLAARLQRLKSLRKGEAAEELRAEIEEALESDLGHWIVPAAKLVAERGWEDMAPQLVGGYFRLTEDPFKRDPGCEAMTAIVETLDELHVFDEKVLLDGVRRHQPRGLADEAVTLRVASALALARSGHARCAELLACLLADRFEDVRIGAARAIGATGSPAFTALLHYKLLHGDDEPGVVQECLGALWDIEGVDALPTLKRHLQQTNEDIAEAAAYALAQVRHPQAVETLLAWWRSPRGSARPDVALFALALCRREETLAELFRVLREAPPLIASDSLPGLALYRDDPRIVEAVGESLHRRPELLPRWKELCGG